MKDDKQIKEMTNGQACIEILEELEKAFYARKFITVLDELRKKYGLEPSWKEMTHFDHVDIPHTIESIADLAYPESEN